MSQQHFVVTGYCFVFIIDKLFVQLLLCLDADEDGIILCSQVYSLFHRDIAVFNAFTLTKLLFHLSKPLKYSKQTSV